MTAPETPVPDDKDWTWVVEQPCPECGFDPAYDVTTTGDRLRTAVPRWESALGRPDATTRPAPSTWSPTEYAAHVRDVCTLFGQRLDLMLTDDGVRLRPRRR